MVKSICKLASISVGSVERTQPPRSTASLEHQYISGKCRENSTRRVGVARRPASILRIRRVTRSSRLGIVLAIPVEQVTHGLGELLLRVLIGVRVPHGDVRSPGVPHVAFDIHLVESRQS